MGAGVVLGAEVKGFWWWVGGGFGRGGEGFLFGLEFFACRRLSRQVLAQDSGEPPDELQEPFCVCVQRRRGASVQYAFFRYPYTASSFDDLVKLVGIFRSVFTITHRIRWRAPPARSCRSLPSEGVSFRHMMRSRRRSPRRRGGDVLDTTSNRVEGLCQPPTRSRAPTTSLTSSSTSWMRSSAIEVLIFRSSLVSSA